MATIDQQFVEFIVKTLVSKPEAVTVEREIDERGVLLSLTVDPEDIGRVIGKRGATAQSLRTLLRVLGTKNGARYNLKIINTDENGAEIRPASAPASQEEPAAEAEEHTEAADVAAEEAIDEPEATKESEKAEESEESDLAAKTRAELADLDDLDI